MTRTQLEGMMIFEYTQLEAFKSGDRVVWGTKTYIMLGLNKDCDKCLLYTPSGTIAKWPKTMQIMKVDDNWTVYSPEAYDLAVNKTVDKK